MFGDTDASSRMCLCERACVFGPAKVNKHSESRSAFGFRTHFLLHGSLSSGFAIAQMNGRPLEDRSALIQSGREAVRVSRGSVSPE